MRILTVSPNDVLAHQRKHILHVLMMWLCVSDMDNLCRGRINSLVSMVNLFRDQNCKHTRGELQYSINSHQIIICIAKSFTANYLLLSNTPMNEWIHAGFSIHSAGGIQNYNCRNIYRINTFGILFNQQSQAESWCKLSHATILLRVAVYLK